MAFGLLIIYITILLVRPQEWWPPIADYELVNVTAILTLFTAFITQGPNDNRIQALTRNRFARFIFGLLVAVGFSQLERFRFRGALDAFAEFGKMVVLFSLTLILVDSPRRLRIIMWVITLSAALLSISAILQVRTGYGFGGVKPFGSFDTGDFRVMGTGLFADPNDFATIFLIATPFVFALLQIKGMLVSKGFLLCTLPAFLYTLYYTQSRGAVAGFSLLLIAYLWVGQRVTILRVILTVALLSAGVAFGPSRARETVYEGSAAGRVVAWGIGNAYLKSNPLFGIGYSRWGELEDRAPHSSFVQCYAELGLVGYYFWFGLCWCVLRALFRITRLKDQLSREVVLLARGLFAALAGYLGSAFFLTHAYHPPLYFLLGLGTGLIRFVERQPNIPRGTLLITARDLRWVAILMLLSIPAIWIVIKAYWASGGTGD